MVQEKEVLWNTEEVIMFVLNIEELSTNWDNLKHINTVRVLLNRFICELECRGIDHDGSKLEKLEVGVFAEYVPKLMNCTYGSEEYNQFLGEMRPALDHHYANNRHHPEFWENGVNDMTLEDLVEMFCDWMAATKRHKDGNIIRSIEINSGRFAIDSQLKGIFLNTIKRFFGEEGGRSGQ